jgi:hypothetical protein
MIGFDTTYTAPVDGNTFCAQFNADTAVTPLVTMTYQSALTAGENPTFAFRETLSTIIGTGSPAVGTFDFTDPVFDGSQQLTGSTQVETFYVYKSTGTAATSPLLARFDTATGLPLIPNTADVTVVVNENGAWKI